MMDLPKRINWEFLAAVLVVVGVWTAIGWELYHAFHTVQ
jgi:hypothetical protein